MLFDVVMGSVDVRAEFHVNGLDKGKGLGKDKAKTTKRKAEAMPLPPWRVRKLTPHPPSGPPPLWVPLPVRAPRLALKAVAKRAMRQERLDCRALMRNGSGSGMA